MAGSALVPGTVLLALPRFTDFVVKVGGFLRHYGADRRIKIAQAREAEAKADAARARIEERGDPRKAGGGRRQTPILASLEGLGTTEPRAPIASRSG